MGDLDQSIRRAPFDAGRAFVARKEFAVQGHRFSVGDAFRWRHLAVSQRLLRQLWAQSYVDCVGSVDSAPLVLEPDPGTPTQPEALPEIGVEDSTPPEQAGLFDDDAASAETPKSKPGRKK